MPSSDTALKSGQNSAALFRLVLGGLVFIGIPLLVALGCIDWLETSDSLRKTARNNSFFSALLNRIESAGDPLKRYEAILRHFAGKRLPVDTLHRALARLMRRERGALEIHVFSADGRMVPGVGTFRPPKVLAQKFLAALIKSDAAEISETLAEGYCGKNDGARLFRDSPGTFIDLLNSDQKSFGGWWSFRGSDHRIIAHAIAFIHNRKVRREHALDLAVNSFHRRHHNRVILGWKKPFESDRLRPAARVFPTGLAANLATMAPGQVTFNHQSREGFIHVTQNGMILFGLPIVSPRSTDFVGLRVACLLFAGIGGLLYIRFSGVLFPPVFLLAGKLIMLLLAGSGAALTILLLTSLIDRQNRESILREEVRRQQLQHLAKINLAFRAAQNRRFQAFQRFADRLSSLPGNEMAEHIRDFFPKLRKNSRSPILGYLVLDSHRRVVLENMDEIRLARGKHQTRILFRRLLNNTLDNLKNRARTAGSPPQAAAESSPEELPERPQDRDDGTGARFYLGRNSFAGFGQDLQSFAATIGDPGNPEFIFLIVVDPRVSESVFLHEFTEKWHRRYQNLSRFAAIPRSNHPSLSVFPGWATQEFRKLAPVREAVLGTGITVHRTLDLRGEEVLISADSGSDLQNYILLVTYPMREIWKEARRLNRQLGLMAFGLLVLSGIAGWAVSRVLLQPIQRLCYGLEALSQRQFQVRIPSHPFEALELAKVEHQFNRIMENLGELHSARGIQETLWPEGHLINPDWSVVGKCLTAAELGGDFLDWFTLPDGRGLFAAGDVAGHGVAASLITASAKAELFMHAGSDVSPADILNRMNQGFLRNTGRLKPMTLWLGIFDPASRLLQFCAAGNPYPVLRHADGSSEMLAFPAMPIGAKKGTYRNQKMTIAPGDRLVVYSDGLIEAAAACGGEPFGYDRFQTLVAETGLLPPEEAVSIIFQRIETWSGLTVPLDDMTLVLFSTSPCRSDRLETS